MTPSLRFAAILVLAVTACAPSTPASPGGTARSSAGTSAPKTIAIGMDEEVKNFWDGLTSGGGSGARELANLFNQHLVAISSDGSPQPRLLAELPSVENGSWRVLPDGRMETTDRKSVV